MLSRVRQGRRLLRLARATYLIVDGNEQIELGAVVLNKEPIGEESVSTVSLMPDVRGFFSLLQWRIALASLITLAFWLHTLALD